MPELKTPMFVIAVNDLARSADYYHRVLGFTVREIGDDGWRIFQQGDVRIMAGHCPDATPAHDLGDHSYFAYINVNGIDEYFAEVKAKGARLIKSLRDELWGMREFGVMTVDGHRIMFGHELAR